MTRLSEVDVDRALRKVAQLRALFRRLPHHPTPAETRLLAEFDALRGGRTATASRAALRAGFRAAWAAREYGAIVSVAGRLPSGMIEEDAEIRTYVHHASLRARDGGAGAC